MGISEALLNIREISLKDHDAGLCQLSPSYRDFFRSDTSWRACGGATNTGARRIAPLERSATGTVWPM